MDVMKKPSKIYNIVAVDDSKIDTMFIRCQVKREKDFRIRTFTDPRKGLSHIKSRVKNGDAPDAVIVDRRMPFIPGDALAILIGDISKDIMLILYTNDDVEFAKSAKNSYNFSAVCEKTIAGLDEVVNLIRKTK